MSECQFDGLGGCKTCGSTVTEVQDPDFVCPFADLTPGLVESHPITAGVAGACNPSDGVCEACQ